MADILDGMSDESIKELATYAKGLSDNPETRSGFLSLVKKANPAANIPEIDLPAQFNTLLAGERAEREKIQKQLLERDVRDNIERQRGVIMKQGIAESEVADVEKIMTEQGIVNHETAAKYYLAQKRMATPTPPVGNMATTHQLPVIDSKPFGGNVRAWGKSEGMKVWNELKQAQN
jgi:hypothetical protein